MARSGSRHSDKAGQQPFVPVQQESAGKLALLIIGLLLMKLAAYRFYGASNQSAARTVVDKPSSPSAVAKPPLPAITEPASAQASGSAIVTKCVENSRTSYGDQACAADATATQLRTHANQSLLDSWKPAKATPNTLEECKSIQARIKSLDDWARQPQDAQMQD